MSDSNSHAYVFPKTSSASRDEGATADGAGLRRTATRADILDGVFAACPTVPRSQAREVFEMALEEVCETLKKGESVRLRAFGHFNVREKRERIGRNPRTGVEVPIKPRRVLTFKASPVLLDQVNGREAHDRETRAVDERECGH